MLKYEITPELLECIKKITKQITELNHQIFSRTVLLELEAEAHAQSSFSSTSIEGNPLPLTEVKKIIKNRPHQIRNTEREVINYNTALIELNKRIQTNNIDFNSALILQVQKQVTTDLSPKFQCGKYRKEAVFVNNPKLKKTIYWPPDYQDVPGLMAALFGFVNENKNKIDPIILAGLFHKQFVMIHPFVDGNGRTVRLLTKAILALLGVNTFQLFSFEKYYNQNVTNYFAQVGVRGNYYNICKKINFTGWLEYFANGILDELLRVRKIAESTEIKLHQQNSNPNNQASSEQSKILRFIQKNGHIKDKDYARITARAKATRALDFKKLIQLGLIEKKGNGPATYYILAVKI